MAMSARTATSASTTQDVVEEDADDCGHQLIKKLAVMFSSVKKRIMYSLYEIL